MSIWLFDDDANTFSDCLLALDKDGFGEFLNESIASLFSDAFLNDPLFLPSSRDCSVALCITPDGSTYPGTSSLSITGMRIGLFRIIHPSANESGDVSPERVFCVCDCGNVGEYMTNNIKSGRTRSCGCVRAGLSPREGFKNLPSRGDVFGRLLCVGDSYIFNKIRYSPCVCVDCEIQAWYKVTALRDNAAKCSHKESGKLGFGALSVNINVASARARYDRFLDATKGYFDEAKTLLDAYREADKK